MLPIVEKKFTSLSKNILIKKFYARAFSANTKLKVLIVFEPNRISFCQVYPFMYYRADFESKFGAEFRFVSSSDILNRGAVGCKDADLVLFQTWFTISEANMMKTIDFLRQLNPRAKMHFVDSFAPSDLRLSGMLDDHIDGYITKTIMENRGVYDEPMIGGVYLVDYYHKLYSIEGDVESWSVSPSILGKVKLSPTFVTGPEFLEFFESQDLPSLDNRSVDLHARMAVEGTPWYSQMRTHAENAAKQIEGINVVSGFGVSRKEFMAEMNNSKLCFSPFGYGEICWRDVEAVMAGAVLIKPDMGHLEMDPVMHIPDETYVSIKWDFTDLEEKVRDLLSDDEKRHRIARNADNLLRNYVKQRKFVEQFSYLFV